MKPVQPLNTSVPRVSLPHFYIRSSSDFEVNEEAADFLTKTVWKEVCFHYKPVLGNLLTSGVNGMSSLLLHPSR